MQNIEELKAEIEKAEKELKRKKDNLRIAEKEKEIQIGNYVEATNLFGERIIGKLTNNSEDIVFFNKTTAIPIIDSSIKKWQPKRGDLCIFWDNDVNESIITMFEYSVTKVYFSNQKHYLNCIPFISEEQFKEHIGYEKTMQ